MFPKFYENQGRRCGQTIIKSVATGETLSYQELEKLTGRMPNQITTPVQIAYGLHQLGVSFYYPVKSEFFEDFEKTKKQLLDEFGEEILKRTNLSFIQNSLLELRKKGKYSKEEIFNLDRVQPIIDEGKIPICLINFDKYVGREDKKEGHYLIIHEIWRDGVRIMDSGPSGANPDKKIYLKKLEKSLMSTPWDYGWIFVQNN